MALAVVNDVPGVFETDWIRFRLSVFNPRLLQSMVKRGESVRGLFIHHYDCSWLPECNSFRSRPGRAEPEVWFRIVHVTLDGSNGTPVATYREQTVEIALGPKGAFEYGNIGTLTRHVAAERIVSAATHRRGRPRPPKKPRTPRVVELLQKALEWQGLLKSGEAANRAEIARGEGLSRARVTQVMSLLRLAPEIREYILSMTESVGRPTVTERALRPISRLENTRDQLRRFLDLIERAG